MNIGSIRAFSFGNDFLILSFTSYEKGVGIFQCWINKFVHTSKLIAKKVIYQTPTMNKL